MWLRIPAVCCTRKLGSAVLPSHSWDEKIPSEISAGKEAESCARRVCEEAAEDDPGITGWGDTDRDVINIETAAGAVLEFGRKKVKLHREVVWEAGQGSSLLRNDY